MAEVGVKLIGAWFSPFVRKVEWALKLKGIEYEYLGEDLRNKSSLLLQSNPVHKKVPVVIHGGKAISESLVIIEYIDDAWKQNPLFPSDPYERAVARFWAKFAEEQFGEVVRQVLHRSGEQQKKEVEKALVALEVLEGELVDGRKFFGGEKLGLVDIVLGWTTYWLGAIEEAANAEVFDARKFPLMDRWMKNMAELPLIKENLPLRDDLVRGFQLVRKIKGSCA